MSLPSLPNSSDDFVFYMGEEVVAAPVLGVVVGQFAHRYKEDSYAIEYTDEDGFVVSREFGEHLISKTRKQ